MELFFDLVFVFVVTQVTHEVEAQRMSGALRCGHTALRLGGQLPPAFRGDDEAAAARPVRRPAAPDSPGCFPGRPWSTSSTSSRQARRTMPREHPRVPADCSATRCPSRGPGVLIRR
ncbi:hypothetical protein [Nonomuraea sp. SYSU D8015]|uniref:hypothetical protein n=1 Tax=Nonomuraea sp. SYSU D8015 TaxID=2593644 RepID=UPI001CB731EF